MKIKSVCLALVTLLMLSACAGEAVTTVRYIPLTTAGGRMCGVQCAESSDRCEQICVLNERNCVGQMQARAIKDYENYVRDKWLSHEPVDLRPSDFERPEKCVSEPCYQSCQMKHQACYKSCGGTIETNSSCSFLCFK